MDQLVSGIEGLTAPAILNVGQPLFAGKAGVLGSLGDWNLPDFEQGERHAAHYMQVRRKPFPDDRALSRDYRRKIALDLPCSGSRRYIYNDA